MNLVLARHWWALVIRGLVGVAVGVLTFIWPTITFIALVFLFAGYALVDGVLNLVAAVRAAQAHEHWMVLTIEGVVGIGAAIVTVLWPGITALALVLVIGAWAIVTGALEVSAAVKLRRYIDGEWLLALSGILSMIFGILIMIAPLAGALVIALWVGAYAFVSGAILIALGFRLRSWDRELHTGPTVAAPAH